MDEISRLVASPEFWFTAVFVQLLVGLLTNWISKHASPNWLSYLLLINSMVLAALPMLGYALGSYPWFINFGFGLLLGFFYAVPALVPSPVMRTFALLALNAPAVWIGWRISNSNIPDKLDGFLSVYLLIAMVWGVVIQFWVLFAYPGDKLWDAIEQTFSRLRCGK